MSIKTTKNPRGAGRKEGTTLYEGGTKVYTKSIPLKAFPAMDEFAKEQRKKFRIKQSKN